MIMGKRKVKIKYSVVKEKEFEVDEDTFDTNENIQKFWNQLQTEEDCISIKGIKLIEL
jgi:hypothetical protein